MSKRDYSKVTSISKDKKIISEGLYLDGQLVFAKDGKTNGKERIDPIRHLEGENTFDVHEYVLAEEMHKDGYPQELSGFDGKIVDVTWGYSSAT